MNLRVSYRPPRFAVLGINTKIVKDSTSTVTESEFGTDLPCRTKMTTTALRLDDKNAHKCDLCGFLVLLHGGFVNARQILYELFCWLSR